MREISSPAALYPYKSSFSLRCEFFPNVFDQQIPKPQLHNLGEDTPSYNIA